MSSDVKIFCACNHVVNNIVYLSNKCPRCYGKGYFFDIYFNYSGEAVLTSSNIKLQQEMLKIIIDSKYDNLFHPLWGTDISSIIGTKNIKITRTKLEVIIRAALDYLKNVQINEYLEYKNLTDEEILDKIVDIKISPLTPTGWNIKITISNLQGQELIQSINI